MIIKGAVSDIRTKTEYHSKAEFKARKLFSYASLTIGATRPHYEYVKREVFSLISPLSRGHKVKLVNQFSKVFNEFGFAKAYKQLKAITAPVHQVIEDSFFDDYFFLYDDEARKSLADQLAINCYNQVEVFSRQIDARDLSYEESVVLAYQHICEFTKHFKIKPKYNPFPRKRQLSASEAESGLLRFFDGDYWLNHFEQHTKRINEHIAIALGYVGKRIAPYVSNGAYAEFIAKRKANLLYLKMMDAVSVETGDKFNLLDLVSQTSSNPEKRRIELMVRCRGLEDIARKKGFDAVFLTITAPSKYHKNSKKWNGASPKETSKYLCQLWSRIRAELARQRVDYQGVRVSEPHADATPHWHILIFVKPNQRRLLTTITRQYATKLDRKELITSHKKHISLVRMGRAKAFRPHWYTPRFTCELIDPERGSATGYIAKYISKNINGSKMEGQIDDEAEISVDGGADRVTAWASTWGIRQFQFFGAVSVSVWRECRRAGVFECPSMELVRQAADKGDWQEFSEYMSQSPLVLTYEVKAEVNQYNEQIKKITGLALADKSENTRGLGFELQRRVATSWSPVTNCTNTGYGRTLSNKDRGILEKIGLDSRQISMLEQGFVVSDGHGISHKIRNNQLIEVRHEQSAKTIS